MEDSTSSSAPPMQKTPQSKKILYSAVAGVGILLLLGLGGYMVMGKKDTKVSTQANPSPTKSMGSFGSIKDALSKSLSLECNYSENGKKTTAYIKAGLVRANVTGATEKENANVIIRDDVMYFWNGTQGMKMAFDIDAMVDEEDENAPPVTKGANGVLEGLERFREHCKSATVADSLFVPPSTVKFIDQTAMMKSLKDVPKSSGSGKPVNEEQMRLMKENMQKYQKDVPQN